MENPIRKFHKIINFVVRNISLNTTIKINAQDLNERFINSIKEMFGNKNIEINISEDVDDTDYLFRSAKNGRLLLISESIHFSLGAL